MCNPMAFMMAATVLQGYTANLQGRFQERVAGYRARVAENKAVQTRNRGVEEEIAQREATEQMAARQRARLAAAGVDITKGSPLALQEETALLGEVDALTIRRNFQEQAAVFDQEAGVSLFEGEQDRNTGRNEFTGSILGAVGKGIGGGVADKWFNSKSSAVTMRGSGQTFESFA